MTAENPHLEFEKVVTIIYEADLVALLPSEEVANTLHHVFYGYLYNKVHLSWYNWRFCLKYEFLKSKKDLLTFSMLTFGLFAPLMIPKDTASRNLIVFEGGLTRFFTDVFSLDLTKAVGFFENLVSHSSLVEKLGKRQAKAGRDGKAL